jgi:putative membrane protein
MDARGGPSRLHPLTPLLRSARGMAVIIAAISWQGYAQLGLPRWLLLVLVVLVLAFLLSVVSWFVTGYEVAGRELRISEGLLFRRHRTIPLERLQAVDVVRPVLARLTGLAELKLEVVGAHKTEAPLSYLTVRQAAALRERLLSIAAAARATAEPAGGPVPVGPAGGPVAAEPVPDGSAAPVRAAVESPAAPAAPPVPPAERLVHAVANRQLLTSQLLTPHVWATPLALLAVALPYLQNPVLTFVGIASTVTALGGVLLRPIRRVVDDWHFRIDAGPAGLTLRHGLLETRVQTLPARRVQAVGVTWPLLWRAAGWVHARIDIAGYGAHDRQAGTHVDRLLPVASRDTARRVIAEVLDGVDVGALRFVPAPRRARWLAPLRQPNLGVALDATVLAVRDGWLTREVVLVPYARVQSVRVVQGPLRRWLRLATVHVDTAGALPAVAADRAVGEAYALAEEVSRRVRAARSRAT